MPYATMTKSLILSLLTLVMFLGETTTAVADRNNFLKITKVEVVLAEDARTTKFTITGDHFNFRRDLAVTLGEIGPLTIVEATERRIVATWPSPIADGDYLLTVSTDNGPGLNDEYDLTVKVAPSDCPCEGQTAGDMTWDGALVETSGCSIKIGNRIKITELTTVETGRLSVFEFEGTGSYQCRVNASPPSEAQIVENLENILIADACRHSIIQIAIADGVFECEFEHEFP
jgi:hypothetical protein